MPRLISLLILLALVAAACGDDGVTATDDDPGTRPSVAGDWILESLTVDGMVVALPADDLEITIELGRISGGLGCNSFFGEIDAADDGTLTIGAIGQTEMACMEQERMDFEVTYGQALGSLTAWAVDPTGMTFSGDAVEIRYRQAPAPVHQPLEATVWHLDTIYSGEGPDRGAENRADMEGVTLVIIDGEAVMAGPGCVDWRGDVESDGATSGPFTLGAYGGIEPAACAIVAEAMGLLADSTGFMIDEDRLTFIGEPGETVGFSARS